MLLGLELSSDVEPSSFNKTRLSWQVAASCLTPVQVVLKTTAASEILDMIRSYSCDWGSGSESVASRSRPSTHMSLISRECSRSTDYRLKTFGKLATFTFFMVSQLTRNFWLGVSCIPRHVSWCPNSVLYTPFSSKGASPVFFSPSFGYSSLGNFPTFLILMKPISPVLSEMSSPSTASNCTLLRSVTRLKLRLWERMMWGPWLTVGGERGVMFLSYWEPVLASRSWQSCVIHQSQRAGRYFRTLQTRLRLQTLFSRWSWTLLPFISKEDYCPILSVR